jgi:hypothetical protein
MAKAKDHGARPMPARGPGGKFVSAGAVKTAPVARAAFASPKPKPASAKIARFFDALAESPNVTAAAKAARIDRNWVYREQRRNPRFAARWKAALGPSYVRLETEMLADALGEGVVPTDDDARRDKAQRDRVRVTLFNAHGAKARAAKPEPDTKPHPGISSRKRLEARLAQMHQRMKAAGLC